jgi:hypothetical protein
MTEYFECNPSDPGDMLMEILELKRQLHDARNEAQTWKLKYHALERLAVALMDAVQLCMDKDVGVRRKGGGV